MIRSIINVLNSLIPKKRRVVISVFPNFEDNGIAIAKYLDEYKNLPIFFINRDSRYNSFIEPSKNISILRYRSLKSIYYLITSKYVFFTHGSVIKKLSKKQIVFNLWHGYGYKPVGVLIGNKGIAANYTSAVSPHCKEIFSEMFDVPADSVRITGFPRNDRLFGNDKTVICKKLKLDSSKIILFWLPTYRKSVVGEIREDGVIVENSFGLKEFNPEQFDEILGDNNAICVIKPHPMAAIYDSKKSFKNIVFINDNYMHDNGVTLYPFLSVTDCLISDLSSVIIDYTFVDKPIICFVEDLDEYSSSRGILFEDFKSNIPGPIVENSASFYEIIRKFFKEGDLFPEKRKRLQNEFHSNIDAKSSERVINTIKLN